MNLEKKDELREVAFTFFAKGINFQRKLDQFDTAEEHFKDVVEGSKRPIADVAKEFEDWFYKMHVSDTKKIDKGT